jgi:hypothetical protein
MYKNARGLHKEDGLGPAELKKLKALKKLWKVEIAERKIVAKKGQRVRQPGGFFLSAREAEDGNASVPKSRRRKK